MFKNTTINKKDDLKDFFDVDSKNVLTDRLSWQRYQNFLLAQKEMLENRIYENSGYRQ